MLIASPMPWNILNMEFSAQNVSNSKVLDFRLLLFLRGIRSYFYLVACLGEQNLGKKNMILYPLGTVEVIFMSVWYFTLSYI